MGSLVFFCTYYSCFCKTKQVQSKRWIHKYRTFVHIPCIDHFLGLSLLSVTELGSLLLCLLAPLYTSIIFPIAAHNSSQHSLITGLYQDSYIRLAIMQIHTSCISYPLDKLVISLLVLRNANKASSVFLFSFPLTSHCLRITNLTIKWMTNKTGTSLCFLFPFSVPKCTLAVC